MKRSHIEALQGAGSLIFMAALLFCGFAGLALLARWLVYGWQWALSPLGLPTLATNALAIVLAATTAYYGWRLICALLPRAGGGLDA